MSDFISREAAAETVRKWTFHPDLCNAIRTLPSVRVTEDMVTVAYETFCSQGFSDGPDGDRKQIREMLEAALRLEVGK